jgi:hypothetical protein
MQKHNQRNLIDCNMKNRAVPAKKCVLSALSGVQQVLGRGFSAASFRNAQRILANEIVLPYAVWPRAACFVYNRGYAQSGNREARSTSKGDDS